MRPSGLFRLAWFAPLLVSVFLAQLAAADTHDLVLERKVVNVTGRERTGMMINGQLPGLSLIHI